MPSLRRPLLALAENRLVEGTIQRHGLPRRIVRRFVAGEDLASALAAARSIADQGMTTTLDQLGEDVANPQAVRAAVASYRAILTDMAAAGLEPNISVKLTMLGLGLDLDDHLPRESLRPILETARAVGGFVRLDMEGSAYTARTMDLFARLHDDYPDEVGIVIQSYLYRARDDVERMIARAARVRLVKGAYAEPASIAYQVKRDVDASYIRLMERLLDAGRYPAIATHDPALIRAARGYALRMGIPPERFEFQMLYGVRRDEQTALTTAGYRVRVYVPFGTQWYPYFTRRIAERPANALFVLRQLVSR